MSDLTKQDGFVSGTPALTAALGAAAGGLAPPALAAIGLAGALTGWAAIPLSMLGAGAFIMIDKGAAKLVEKHRADQLTKEMDGWLDITG